jgi:hypothetical protein
MKQVWKTFTKNGQGQSRGRGGHMNQSTNSIYISRVSNVTKYNIYIGG